MHPEDARQLSCAAAAVVVSRRGEIRARVETRGRNKPPQAGVRAVLRRQQADQQGHPGRHRPDFQADRHKKCAVRIELLNLA